MIIAEIPPVQQKESLLAVPRIPEGRRVYAVGDLHGRFDLLCRIHDLIAKDAAQVPGVSKTLVYLGDFVDRGPGTFEIIDELINRPLVGFDLVFLKGNHEDMLLDFLDHGDHADVWLANGGLATLRGYGIDAEPFSWAPRPAGDLRRAFGAALPLAHLHFFRTLDLYHIVGDYVFVHAGIRPGRELGEQQEGDFMWIRHEFLDHEGPFPGIVVHGHTISALPDFRTHRIGIDTGAYRSGRLTCLVLQGEDRHVLQT